MGRINAGVRPPFIEDRYKRDLNFRRTVDYTAEHGIPYSEYTGKVAEEGAPRWTAEDRTIIAVWQQMQRSKCSRCGTWDWEWEEDSSAWTADFWRCHGCEQVDKAHERLHERQSKAGMQVRLFEG